MRLILLGCPGAGKGTQAKFIAQYYHIPHISTGDIFRTAITQGTPLGLKVKSIVDSGQLVPDELVLGLVKQRLAAQDCANGFLLDGFPRTLQQAHALHEFTHIDAIVDIEVEQGEIIKRLTGRRIHPASGRVYHLQFQPPKVPNKDDITGEDLVQREDDMEATVRHRLQVYDHQTSPLKEFYQNYKINSHKPAYIRIDGIGKIDEINTAIITQLNLL
jgi:adenylate kinase